MRFFTCLTDDHNLWLVALAAGLCLIGSIITFRLYRRLRAAQKGTRLAWAFMGACPVGRAGEGHLLQRAACCV